MKHSAAWILFLSACCRAIPLDSLKQCGVTLDQEPSCKNGVLEGFDNASPITSSSCPMTLSVDIKGATYSLVTELDEDPRERGYPKEWAITRFDNKIAPQEIKFEDGVLSIQSDFRGKTYRYVLNEQRGLYENRALSFYAYRAGHFEGKIGYKCINNVAKMILLPPADSVFIVNEPDFDGDFISWSYGTPTGGVLSYGGGRNHHIHDIYVNFQR